MKIIVNQKDVEKFNNSEVGKTKNMYFKRAKITGVILIMIGSIWILLNLLNEIYTIYEFILASITILFGLYFLFYTNVLKKKEVNKYIYSKKSSK